MVLMRKTRTPDFHVGTIVWPDGADIDPDVLYHGGTPEWAPKYERTR